MNIGLCHKNKEIQIYFVYYHLMILNRLYKTYLHLLLLSVFDSLAFRKFGGDSKVGF